jgi:hypothetical protein
MFLLNFIKYLCLTLKASYRNYEKEKEELFDQKQSIYSQEPKWVDDLRNIFYLIFFGIFYGLFALLVAVVVMNNYFLLILSTCLTFLNASLASIKI